MRQESGRSMIEMLGVLTIMGVLTVGAIGMISTAMRTQKRNAAFGRFKGHRGGYARMQTNAADHGGRGNRFSHN